MAIIDHGSWERYIPDPAPAGIPSNVMFARRIGDNVDWYVYLKSKPFAGNSVVMTVEHTSTGEDLVQAATRDPSMIFPQLMSVIEETEYSGTEPQKDLGGRLYDTSLRKIGDKYVPPPPTTQPRGLV